MRPLILPPRRASPSAQMQRHVLVGMWYTYRPENFLSKVKRSSWHTGNLMDTKNEQKIIFLVGCRFGEKEHYKKNSTVHRDVD